MAIGTRTIGEFISGRDSPNVSPATPVQEAIQTMRAMRTPCVLVVEAGLLQGIFTEKDFLNRVVAAELLPGETRVGEVMTPSPEVLGPDHSIAQAINRMAIGGFRNVPIVDEHGRPLGLLSVRDVVDHLAEIFEGDEEDSNEQAGLWLDLGVTG